MKENQYKWKLRDQSDAKTTELAEQTKINPIIIKILIARGYDTPEAISHFIKMDASIVHDPFLLHDMEKACQRIFQAVEKNEKILIYGDYDADGVTSTTIMYETLDQLGANVDYFVPNRFKDGYGPNLGEYQHFINDEQVQLIVTVDNGIAGHEALAYAKTQNVDVIVTDHHELPAELPEAYAIVHPRHPDGNYPFGDLSGVGVAFKVATALLEEIPEEFLDLYALGTVADLVSMTDENRFLVKMGLEVMSQTARIGLQKLIEVAGADLDHLDEQVIGFTIAPRINAVGRLEDASQAVQLLTTFDEDEAVDLAKKINQINSQRQGLVNEIFEAANQIANDETHINQQTLVIAGHNWHQGVLGIVASRIVELTNKPAIILSDQNQDGIYKGSGRSVHALNLFEAIDPIREQLIGFGGHHMAIGVTIEEKNLSVLTDQLELAAAEVGLDSKKQPELLIDVQASISDFSVELVNNLQALGPFGTDNPVPKFEINTAHVQNVKAIGQDASHLKFSLVDEKNQLDVIAFKRGEIADTLANISNPINVVGTLGLNEWRGNISLQLMADDIQIEGLQVVDQRTTNLSPNLFENDNIYVCFNPKLLQVLEKQMPNRKFKLYDTITKLENDQTLVLVDCPDNWSVLTEVVEQAQPKRIITYFFHQIDLYASGMPDRDEFKQIFAVALKKGIKQTDLPSLAKKIKVDQEKINFMIKVFFELDFFKNESGILIANREAPKHQLSEAKVYQKRLKAIEVQEKLLYNKSEELQKLFEELVDR